MAVVSSEGKQYNIEIPKDKGQYQKERKESKRVQILPVSGCSAWHQASLETHHFGLQVHGKNVQMKEAAKMMVRYMCMYVRML